jgi:hypothetical protein
MEVEVSLPPNTVPGGSVERSATALSAASSDGISPSHIKATSRPVTPASKVGYFNSATMRCRITFKLKTITQECEPTAVAPALNVNGVTSRTSSMGNTVSAFVTPSTLDYRI